MLRESSAFDVIWRRRADKKNWRKTSAIFGELVRLSLLQLLAAYCDSISFDFPLFTLEISRCTLVVNKNNNIVTVVVTVSDFQVAYSVQTLPFSAYPMPLGPKLRGLTFASSDQKQVVVARLPI